MSTRKRKHARAVALSLLMILSVVAGSLAVTGAASGTPGGMVGVPSENIESDLPPKTPMGEAAQRIEDKGVLTSKHADTLEVFVTNPGRAKKYTDGAVFGSGPIAIVVRDDVHDAGRRVALPKDVLVDILGHVPEMAYGTHDSGEKWSAETTVEDGYVVVDVPHFSDNVITWSGNFVIEGDPAASGTVYDYEQSNPVSLFTINVTGVVATETDAPSWTGLSSGTTIDPQIAGNLDPASANVTFVGNQYTGSRYTPSGSGDASITVNGDAAPSGPNGGEPEITFTGTKGEWGDVKWSTSAGGELIGAGDRIVVGHRYSETISALYPSDGSVDWTYSMGTDPSFIAVDNTQGQAYITTKTESGVDELHAVDLYTGNNLWTKSLDDNAERIAVNENSGKIVINQDTGIEAYDADGSLLCSEDLGSWPVSSLAVDDSSGRIYVGKGDGSLLVRKSDGSSDFSVSTGMDTVYGLKTDSSAGVFIATSDGVTKAYDLSAGGEQWTYSSGGNNAAIADGIFYTEGGGTLHGIDTSSGSQVRSYSFDAYHIAATNDGVFAGDGGDNTVKIGHVTTTDPSVDIDGDGQTDASYSDKLNAGESVTKQLSDLPVGSVSVDTYVSGGGQPDWTITYDEELYTDSPSVDIDGDGTDEASHSGKLGPGETATYDISPTLSDDSWTLSTAAGSVNVNAAITEQTLTENVTITVNGHETSHPGTLAEGTTESLTADTSWINESGNNTVEAEVAPALSSDAPTPSVDLYYTHEGKDTSVVDYTATKWTEKYNVSKTFATDQPSPNITIPFNGNVVEIKDAEYRINGGSWNTISTYSLSNTTLGAELGSLVAGDTMTVRVNGSKVQAENGAIQVVEPTYLDHKLDSKISVESRSLGDLKIAVSGTPDAETIHYTYDESWSTPGVTTRFTTDGQTLLLPDAGSGDTFRVSTIPVTVDVQTGDVDIQVPDPKSTEPEFQVSPGATKGDVVKFTYVDAQGGEEYVLYSQTDSIVRDSGTASSPLTLEDDDSEETLAFQLAEENTSSKSVSGPVSSTGTDIVPSVGSDWLLYLGIGLAVIIALYLIRNRAAARAGETERAQATTPESGSGGSGLLTRFAVTIQGAIEWVASLLKNTVTYLRSHPYVSATLGAAVVGWLFVTGAIALTESGDILLLSAGIPMVSWIVLRRWGGQSLIVWGGVTGVALIVGLNALGTDVFGVLANSESSPILIMGLIALAYYALNTYRKSASVPDEKNEIIIKGDEQ